MVSDVYSVVDVPIIGIGGIDSAEGLLEMMMAGARAVQVGAANLVNPFACKEIVEQLPKAMERYHIKSLHEIVGVAN